MQSVADVQIRASLIDDYLQIENAPVAPALAGRFVALQDPAAPAVRSLVTVQPDGSLVQVRPDPSSHSGWALTTVPVTPPANSQPVPNRLAGYTQQGVSNLLAYFPVQGSTGSAAVWMQSHAPGTWAQATLSHDSANALGFTYQTDSYIDASGKQYVYGLTGNMSPAAFFLVAFDSTGNVWDIVYEQFVTDFDPPLTHDAVFRLMPGTDGATFNVLWIDQGVLYVQGAALDDQGDFSWASANPTALKLGLGPAGVQQTLAMPGAAGNANLLVIDGTSRLALVEGYTSAQPALVPLSGGPNQPAGVQSASVGVAAGGLLMLFAKETATNRLWILRQTGTGAGGAPVFASWINLGNAVDALACPALMQSDAEIYAVDMQQTLYHFGQTGDRVWASQQLAAPTPSSAPPKNIAATTMHVTTLGATQAPVGGAIVTITSDQPATLVVDNLSYHVGPGTPVQVQADPTGNLTAVFSTISLISPVLTFTVTNTDGSSASRWCHADVVEQKTGEAAIPPCQQSVASRLGNQDPTQPLNSANLAKAGLISPNYPDKNGAATAVVSAGQWLQQNPQAGANSLETQHIKTRHWKLDFRHPAGPMFTELSEEEGRQIVAAAKARREELGDLAGFLGDILNFFKHLWEELEEISAHLVDDVLNLVINGIQYVVQTVREAASALETVFNKIIQGLKDLWQAIVDVINFLKQLFEWGDILLTHQVIKAALNSLMTTLAADADDLETLVQEQFQNLETQIKAAFSNAEKVFQPGQTFNQFANAQGGNPPGGTASASRPSGAPGGGGNALAAGPLNTGFAQHGPRCNYVNSYAKSHFGGAGAATLARLAAGNGSTQGIIDLVNANWTGKQLQTELSQLQGFVTGKIADPNDFFDLVIVDFLIAIEDAVLLILDALENIMLAVIKAMASALGGLQGALNATIDIPVISWLYKYVITGTPTDPGDDLSILDVLALILAVPATILYKVIFGGKAPFSATPEVQQIITSGLPWPPVPTQANLRARLPAPAALQDIPPSLITELGCVSAVACFFGTFITMAADGLAFADEPLPGFAQFVSWSSVIQSIASQAMGAPLAQFAKDAHSWSAADGWTVGAWGGSLVPLAYDTVFTYATGSLARFTEVAGPALDTGNGLALTAIGIVTAIEQAKDPSDYTGWDQADSVVPPIGQIFKFLILTKDTEAEAVALPLLLVIDLVLGIGATVTQIGDAVEG